uniref:NXPE family member 3-like n=1 Tax=Gouania willdenowi TaxID=441366 RepID=A0A8C5DJL0_GOUWI
MQLFCTIFFLFTKTSQNMIKKVFINETHKIQNCFVLMKHNLCAFRPLSPEEAVEEEFILHSIAWPETPPVTLNFSLKNTTDPSCSKFTILPKVGGGQWSIGDQLEVRIIMKDYYCHPKTSGGDALLARLRNEALDAGVSGQVVDHLNGSYTAVFPLVWEGRVTLIHPSEAITVLRRLNNESLDRVFFRSVFRSGSVTETSMCNVCLRPTNMPVCNYTDIRTGEPWFCLKPKSLSCNARIIHSMGGYLPALKPLEDKLFSCVKIVQESVCG